jgi:hypothetical protein
VGRGLEALACALGRPVPAGLAAIVARLDASAWPEIAGRWSTLTPTGFPIELTMTGEEGLRWTTEIDAPEVLDARRLALVASHLAAAGQPVPASRLEALLELQRDRELRYGAWLGGRTQGTRTRYKLYGELPPGTIPGPLPLPDDLRALVTRAPEGTRLRMIGIEPARARLELYLRLPRIDLEDLRPLLRAAGQPRGLERLEHALPDGLRRLAGRQLGISVAQGDGGSIEVALFVSARTLFPGAPGLLRELIPDIGPALGDPARPTLVTLGLDPEGEGVSFAVGVTFAPAA